MLGLPDLDYGKRLISRSWALILECKAMYRETSYHLLDLTTSSRTFRAYFDKLHARAF